MSHYQTDMLPKSKEQEIRKRSLKLDKKIKKNNKVKREKNNKNKKEKRGKKRTANFPESIGGKLLEIINIIIAKSQQFNTQLRGNIIVQLFCHLCNIKIVINSGLKIYCIW